MELFARLAALSPGQLRKLAEQDNAAGAFAAWELAKRTGAEAPDRSAVIIGERDAYIASPEGVYSVPLEKVIARTDDGYCVYSADGEHSFGCYPTLADAQERLAQIHSYREEKADSYKPPKGAQESGQRALDWIAEGHAGSNFTDVGRARAAQLARGDNLSEDTVRRMRSYFARHEVDSQAEGWNAGEDGFPSPGRVAWEAWGGDAGRSWAETLVARWDREATAKGIYIPPADVREAANRALKWERAGHATLPDSVRSTASLLARGAAVSEGLILRMTGFFGKRDKDIPEPGWRRGEPGFPSEARIVWDAWGGDAGRRWAHAVRNRLDKAAFVRKEDSRRFTLGPLYVPDFVDAHGEWTDADELQRAVWGWVQSGDRRIFLQHNREVEAGEWVEVMTMPQPWTVTMQTPSGEEVGEVTYPAGTVFLGVIWNEETWPDVVAGRLRGYSIGGFADRMMADMPEQAARDGVEMG